jgi:hypothetical protein
MEVFVVGIHGFGRVVWWVWAREMRERLRKSGANVAVYGCFEVV